MHLIPPDLYAKLTNFSAQQKEHGSLNINQLNSIQNEDGGKVFISQKSSNPPNDSPMVNVMNSIKKNGGGDESNRGPDSNEKTNVNENSNRDETNRDVTMRSLDNSNEGMRTFDKTGYVSDSGVGRNYARDERSFDKKMITIDKTGYDSDVGEKRSFDDTKMITIDKTGPDSDVGENRASFQTDRKKVPTEADLEIAGVTSSSSTLRREDRPTFHVSTNRDKSVMNDSLASLEQLFIKPALSSSMNNTVVKPPARPLSPLIITNRLPQQHQHMVTPSHISGITLDPSIHGPPPIQITPSSDVSGITLDPSIHGPPPIRIESSPENSTVATEITAIRQPNANRFAKLSTSQFPSKRFNEDKIIPQPINNDNNVGRFVKMSAPPTRGLPIPPIPVNIRVPKNRFNATEDQITVLPPPTSTNIHVPKNRFNATEDRILPPPTSAKIHVPKKRFNVSNVGLPPDNVDEWGDTSDEDEDMAFAPKFTSSPNHTMHNASFILNEDQSRNKIRQNKKSNNDFDEDQPLSRWRNKIRRHNESRWRELRHINDFDEDQPLSRIRKKMREAKKLADMKRKKNSNLILRDLAKQQMRDNAVSKSKEGVVLPPSTVQTPMRRQPELEKNIHQPLSVVQARTVRRFGDHSMQVPQRASQPLNLSNYLGRVRRFGTFTPINTSQNIAPENVIVPPDVVAPVPKKTHAKLVVRRPPPKGERPPPKPQKRVKKFPPPSGIRPKMPRESRGEKRNQEEARLRSKPQQKKLHRLVESYIKY